MKLHQLITTLVILCLPHTSWSMENKSTNSYWVINPKNASRKEKKFEKNTQQILDNFSKKLEITTLETKEQIPTEIYTKIQNQFTPTTKQCIAQLNKDTDLSTQQKELLKQLEKAKQEITECLEQKQKQQQQIDQLKAAIESAKKDKKRQKKIRQRARKKAQKQQAKISPLVTRTSNISTSTVDKTKSEPVTPQQNYYQKRMIALKTLFKKYRVQKEADLKNKLYDICWNLNKNHLDDRINYWSTFEYCANTNDLEIFTDDYENCANTNDSDENTTSDSSNDLETLDFYSIIERETFTGDYENETSDSDHDLEINVTVLQ